MRLPSSVGVTKYTDIEDQTFGRNLPCVISEPEANPLGAVYTRVFSVRCSVRDGAAAQQLPLLFSRDHLRDQAKEVVKQWRHHGRRNGPQ
jgi:phosphoglycerate-specific signal transduction histidine kinase